MIRFNSLPLSPVAEAISRFVRDLSFTSGNCNRGYAKNSDESKLCKNGCGQSRCSIRKCAQEKELVSCADCSDYASCKLLDNFMSKLFGFIFRSNRSGNLDLLHEKGYDHVAEKLKSTGKMTVPKK